MESLQICQTCEKVTSNRCAFEAPLHMDKLRNLSCKNFLDDPMKKVKWATKIYGEWRDHHHSLGLEINNNNDNNNNNNIFYSLVSLQC